MKTSVIRLFATQSSPQTFISHQTNRGVSFSRHLNQHTYQAWSRSRSTTEAKPVRSQNAFHPGSDSVLGAVRREALPRSSSNIAQDYKIMTAACATRSFIRFPLWGRLEVSSGTSQANRSCEFPIHPVCLMAAVSGKAQCHQCRPLPKQHTSIQPIPHTIPPPGHSNRHPSSPSALVILKVRDLEGRG